MTKVAAETGEVVIDSAAAVEATTEVETTETSMAETSMAKTSQVVVAA